MDVAPRRVFSWYSRGSVTAHHVVIIVRFGESDQPNDARRWRGGALS